MNRRKALTAMIGGVAAAPQAAKMAMQQIGRLRLGAAPPPYPPGTTLGYADAECQGTQAIPLEEQRKHLLQRKEQLQALMRGENPCAGRNVPPRHREGMNSSATHSIANLRSVSPQHKSRMLEDLDQRRMDELNRWHWQDELSNIEQSILSWGKLFG